MRGDLKISTLYSDTVDTDPKFWRNTPPPPPPPGWKPEVLYTSKFQKLQDNETTLLWQNSEAVLLMLDIDRLPPKPNQRPQMIQTNCWLSFPDASHDVLAGGLHHELSVGGHDGQLQHRHIPPPGARLGQQQFSLNFIHVVAVLESLDC